MAGICNFSHFKTRAGFDRLVPNPETTDVSGNQFFNHICFIKDTNEIYTHGQFYTHLSKEDEPVHTCYKKIVETCNSDVELTPNAYYRITGNNLSILSFSLAQPDDDTILNEYFVEFTTSDTGTTIGFPSVIKWANGKVPEFSASSTYQVSIVNNLGVVLKFA